MKILTVVLNLEKGGTQRVAQNFAEGYHDLGHDSRILAIEGLGVRAKEILSKGVPIWQMGDITEIKIWSPDVIHIHSVFISGFDSVVNLLKVFEESKKEPIIIETNVFSHPSIWETRVDISFQLSSWCEWVYRGNGGKVKSFIVPNPINISKFFRAPPDEIISFKKKYNISSDEVVLLRVGQDSPIKWSPLLISIFVELCHRRDNLRLIVVNPPQSIVFDIDHLPNEIKQKIVHLKNLKSDHDLCICYSAADIFFHIAEQGESFGLVLAESLLCETAVVSYSTPWTDNSQCEVVPNNLCGYISTNARDMVSAIEELIDNPSLRKEFGVNGRRHIINSFESMKIAQYVLDLVQKTEMTTKVPIHKVSDIYMNNYGNRGGITPILLKFIAINPYIFKIGRLLIQGIAGHTKYSRFLNPIK
ncbi:MAG TPA: glycosyltransferase family 4 protein [Methanoregulaceae archaeon]|nr:glycosyltransferase family 4 protein [Methanoregulaceae archaeon]HRT15982.1 glycosyltransferase family 4 protein [Methanoregulaceae archaeon]HRU31447.1 glycosyltransferase family 4 protein [Methanoregulaceae archaeon]